MQQFAGGVKNVYFSMTVNGLKIYLIKLFAIGKTTKNK